MPPALEAGGGRDRPSTAGHRSGGGEDAQGAHEVLLLVGGRLGDCHPHFPTSGARGCSEHAAELVSSLRCDVSPSGR